jgi:hypothetical protein
MDAHHHCHEKSWFQKGTICVRLDMKVFSLKLSLLYRSVLYLLSLTNQTRVTFSASSALSGKQRNLTPSLVRSMSFTLPSSARAPRWKYSWFCIAFCASTLRTNIMTASSYSHNVTDYRSSSRHRPIASLEQLGILRPVTAHFFTRGGSSAATRSSC